MEKALVPIALFAMIGFTTWVVIASIRRYSIARMQAGVQFRLLERFNSAESLIAYGETATGRQFLTSLVQEREAQTSPYRSILAGVRAGIVLMVFGAALLLLHHTGVTPEDAVLVFGAIPLALGIGFLLAAAATYVLSKSFGLLEKSNSL
jgi:hypothetical protein